MCGIAGCLTPDGQRPDAAAVDAMLDGLAHRGPDDRGLCVEPAIALGHVRLSVIDLSAAAAQPMCSSDERWVLSFNGEIFNFRQLAADLQGRRRSTGDTEVLVECLAQHGVAWTLAHLEGDFAFAAWDRTERVLHLARDRHGVKPLYLREDPDGSVWFASETKVLRTRRTQPDLAAAQSALLGHSCTWGTRTMFHDITSLRPGEHVVVRPGHEPERRRFFSLDEWVDAAAHDSLRRASAPEVVANVRQAFDESMAGRMISDAPLATLVSGGVDSSLVAAVAIASNREMVGYHADVLADSERDPAEDVARTLGLALRTTEVSDERFLEAVPAATWANDVPLTYHLNSVPFFLVCRLARGDGVKVLLTGEGSDEYFLGYPQLALEPAMERVRSARAALNAASHRAVPRLAALLWPRQAQRFSDLLGELVTGYEAELVATSSEAAADHLTDRRERRALRLTLGLIDQHLVSLLHRNDRLGMAWSLESRFPFLGHELARLAINLPATYKLHLSRHLHDRRHPFVTDKWVVRELAGEVVPSHLAGRAKQGFPVSVYDRLELTTATFAGGWVADAFSLDARALGRVVDAGPSVWATRLMLLDTWGRLFVDGSTVEDCQAHLRSTTTLHP